MRPEDGKRFSEIMYEMAETIQGATITERGLRVRFKALMDFSIERYRGSSKTPFKDPWI